MSEEQAVYETTDPIYQKLMELVDKYGEILTIESARSDFLTDARAALETEKARVLLTAYADDVINGKNETVRKLQETMVIDDSNSLYWLGLYERRFAQALSDSENDRKNIEAEISLVKAWPYSQSGRA